MSMTPKFLVVHFNGDFLEHAAFAATAQETEEISCSFRNGADHFDMRCIPIETAAAAPELLEALQGDEENCIPNPQTILSQALLGNYQAVKTMLRELCSIHAAAIAKATE